MYVEGTSEDPTSGAHEAFLDQLLPHAEDVRSFPAGVAADLSSYLGANGSSNYRGLGGSARDDPTRDRR
jgi:hypothetical protein